MHEYQEGGDQANFDINQYLDIDDLTPMELQMVMEVYKIVVAFSRVTAGELFNKLHALRKKRDEEIGEKVFPGYPILDPAGMIKEEAPPLKFGLRNIIISSSVKPGEFPRDLDTKDGDYWRLALEMKQIMEDAREYHPPKQIVLISR